MLGYSGKYLEKLREKNRKILNYTFIDRRNISIIKNKQFFVETTKINFKIRYDTIVYG